jgi:hypothetical protein
VQELILEKRPWFQDVSAESGLSIINLHEFSATNLSIAKCMHAGYQDVWRNSIKIYASKFLFHSLNNLKKRQAVPGTHSDRRWNTGAAIHSSQNTSWNSVEASKFY